MLDRSPTSSRLSAKPSCNSPCRVRKRSKNCDCYSEKRVVRASGQALRLPDMGAYGGLGGRCKTHRFALTHRLFFSDRKLGLYQHSTTAQRSILEHVSICSPSIRSPAWNRTDFCTSDRHSVSLTAERLFRLQGTHVIPMEPHRFLYE